MRLAFELAQQFLGLVSRRANRNGEMLMGRVHAALPFNFRIRSVPTRPSPALRRTAF
jgi:hypothetical protein